MRLVLVTPDLVLCLNEWQYRYAVTSGGACTEFTPLRSGPGPVSGSPFDRPAGQPAGVRYAGMDAVAAAEAVDAAVDGGLEYFVLSPAVLAAARRRVTASVSAEVLSLVDEGVHDEHVAQYGTVYFYKGVFREYALECPFLTGRVPITDEERDLVRQGKVSLVKGPRPLLG